MSNRMPHPGRVGVFRMAAPIHMNLPVAEYILNQNHNGGRRLNELDGPRSIEHRTPWQASRRGIADAAVRNDGLHGSFVRRQRFRRVAAQRPRGRPHSGEIRMAVQRFRRGASGHWPAIQGGVREIVVAKRAEAARRLSDARRSATFCRSRCLPFRKSGVRRAHRSSIRMTPQAAPRRCSRPSRRFLSDGSRR